MKYFVLIFSIAFISFYGNAQKQDTVRWFVGHWVDKKIFKIDSTIYGKGGGGGTVTIKENGSFEISTPESKKFDNAINDVVSSIEEEEKKISTTGKADEGMYQYNLVSKSVKELDQVKEEFKNTEIQKDVSPTDEEWRIRVTRSAVAQNCIAFAPEYHRLIDFYKANKSDKHPHFDLPPPPVADYFNCWGCDSAKRIAYDAATEQYVRDFFKDIGKDISTLLARTQMMEAMGLVNRSSADRLDPVLEAEYSNSRSHPGACSYISYFDMSCALDFYVKRAGKMLEQLWDDNKNNYGAIKPVIRICLAALQQRIAMDSYSCEELMSGMKEFANPMEKLYDKLTTKLIKERDYSLIGTIPFMIGLEKSILSFTGGTLDQKGYMTFEDHWKPKYDYPDVMAFTHFELSIDLDVKIGEKGSYTISHIKSKSKVVAELDDKECVIFTLAKKEEGKIKADIVTNEAIAPGPHGIYVGTKTYTSQSPIFKIRFCEIEGQPKGDSLYLSTFVPLAPDKGNWNVQGVMAPLGINHADRLFINIEELKNDAQNIKPEVDEKQLEDTKKKSLEMAAKIKAMQASGNVDPKKIGEMVKQMMNNTSGIAETQTSELMRIRLPLKVSNMEKILINQRFDAKEINPSFSQPIVYGYLTIKLEHTPANGINND